MITIAVVKNLMVRAGADFSALKKETEKAQKTLSNFKKTTGESMNSVGKSINKHAEHARHGFSAMYKDMLKMSVVMAAVTATFAPLIAAITGVRNAMEVEASIQQINRIMGESSNQFLKWADNTAIAFAMSKSEAMKYGAVYGNLLSTFTKSTGETMKYTEELLKASAVVASGTGRTIEDVMERMRSGMLGNTESIEDLGINVNVAMLESTEAFRKFAGDRSWQQLDFQTQQQIRLFAILEQSTRKYGDSLNNNTATAQQMFIAQMKNVQLALGQAFLPIYSAILPALTNLATALARVMNVVAQFTQALFGKNSQAAQAQAQTKATAKQAGAVNGLGKAYKKAGKEANGALASFDEINSLSKGNSGGDSDGTGGGDVGSSVPQIQDGLYGINSGIGEISPKIQEMANKVKAAFGEIASFISRNKDIIVSALAGILAGFASFAIISNWGMIIEAFSGAIAGIGTALAGISIPILAVSALIALFVANIVYLWRTNEDFRNSVIEVWNNIKDFLTNVASDTWSIVKDIWDKYGQTLINNIAGFMKSIQNIIQAVWENFLKPLITGALQTMSSLWDNHLKGLIKNIGEFIMKLITGVLELWNKFFAPLIQFMVEKLGPIFASVLVNTMNRFGAWLGMVIDVASGLFRALGGIIDFVVGVFTGNWAKAWQGVKDIFRGVFDSLYAIVKTPLNYIIDAINSMIRGLNKLKINVPNIPGITNGFSLGFNIPSIPKLAQGGYIGANSPVLAMVGDNKNEGEIVAPESKIYEQALRAVTDALGSNSGKDRPMEIILKLGETELGRAVINSINKLQRQAGTTLLEV